MQWENIQGEQKILKSAVFLLTEQLLLSIDN